LQQNISFVVSSVNSNFGLRRFTLNENAAYYPFAFISSIVANVLKG